MRVLHLLKTAVGAKWALYQMRVLVELGVDVHVALPHGPMTEQFNAAGIHTHNLQTDLVAYRPWNWPMLFSSLRRLVGGISPDLIHSHFVGTTFTMRLALGNHAIPRFFQVPGPLHLERPLIARAEIAMADHRDQWIAACRWTQNAYVRYGIHAQRVALSYYTTDVHRFSPHAPTGTLHEELQIARSMKLVGMVSYFYPPKPWSWSRRGIKGHEDFIDALRLVRQHDTSILGVIVGNAWGNGSWYEEKVRHYAQQRCPDGIRFLGYRPDVQQLYPEFRVAVHPSLSENVGGALESSLMATPTIATTVGGFPDLIEPGMTGWLTPPADPVALATTIEQAVNDPETGLCYARNARQRALRIFDPIRLGHEIYNLYCQRLGT